MAEPSLIDQRDVVSSSIPTEDIGDIELEISTASDLLDAEELQFLAPEEPPEVERDFDENLAEYLDEETLNIIGTMVYDGYEMDLSSREEWDEIMKDGVDLLGFKVRNEEQEVFDGSATISHPLLAEAVVKFQAKAYKELYPSGGPVKTQVIGTPNKDLEEQASRVRNYLNYQTVHVITEYGEELDRLLFYIGLYGSGFKKMYYDGFLGRPVTQFVKAHDFVTNYETVSLDTAIRYTHRMHVSSTEMQRRMASGLYMEVNIDEPATATDTSGVLEKEQELHGISPSFDSDYYEVLEVYDYITIEDDPFKGPFDVPYIITIEKESQKVLAIRRNWDPNDQTFQREPYFVHYKMIPGLNFYGYGYLHLIGGLSKTSTGVLRQLLDAGTFASLPAGFKAHGLRVLADASDPLVPGEWRDVNAPIGDIGKAFFMPPYKEPSTTLLHLLEQVEALAKEFADATDQVAKESANYGPVGTTLALMEQSAKMYSAIHKRLHAAQTRELKLLARINSDTLQGQVTFPFGGQQLSASPEDFDLNTIDVIPVSDPNIPTEAHRIAKLNAILSVAQQNPAGYNMQQISMELFAAMGIEKPERFLAPPQEPFHGDPISENAQAMIGKPIAATFDEAHDAHLAVHAAALNNPVYAENAGMRQILVAHINDTLAKKFTIEMVQLMGDPQLAQAVLSGQDLPPELQNQIALKAAEVSDQLLAVDQAKAEILNGSGDDATELLNRELDIREAQTQLNHLADMQKLDFDREKLKVDNENKDLDRALKQRDLRVQDQNKDLDRQQRDAHLALKLAADRAKQRNTQ